MFVGVDIGTGSAKLAMLLGDGSLAETSVCYSVASPVGVQSSASLEEACAHLMRRTVDEAVSRGDPILAISASGHGPSLLVVDGQGRAASDVTTWQDSSRASEAAEIASAYPGFSKTGECFEAKLLAAWRNLSEGWKGETALYPKDYFLFLLSGERVIDRAAASTLVCFDPKRPEGSCDWDCDSLDFDERFLPRVANSWERIGETGTAFSRGCGLPDGVPVFAGGIDAWCEAIGAGALAPGDVVDGSGTSTSVSRCLEAHEGSLEHALPERAFRIETISSSGGSALWAEAILGLPIERWKGEAADGAPVPILFLPYLIGERSPVWDEDASALFLGLRQGDSTIDLMSAVFQGTALAVAQCIELLGAPGDAPVRAVGGGNRNLPWIRMKASAGGRDYWIMRSCNAAPIGAAMLAAFGLGADDLASLARKYLGVEEVIGPDKRYRGAFERLGESYGRLYDRLAPEMRMLAMERRRK
jgi:xylulokinase